MIRPYYKSYPLRCERGTGLSYFRTTVKYITETGSSSSTFPYISLSSFISSVSGPEALGRHDVVAELPQLGVVYLSYEGLGVYGVATHNIDKAEAGLHDAVSNGNPLTPV